MRLLILLTALLTTIARSVGAECSGDSNRDSMVSLGEVQQCVDHFLAGCSGVNAHYYDNGDGTVTDNQTGLMWEKKDDAGGIHDKDNTYTWSVSSNDPSPSGSVFGTFLGNLNAGVTGVGNCTSSNGTSQSGGFAGYCDWRLPTIPELDSIRLSPFCASPPCIDLVFGAVSNTFYWSSTTLSSTSTLAWGVYFLNGTPDIDGKNFAHSVRAVRRSL